MQVPLLSHGERYKKLTEEYPFIYGAIGIHPDEVGTLTEEHMSEMEQLLDLDKIVAVGEIGLDYYWDNESHDIQKKWFIRQLETARKKDMPGNHTQQGSSCGYDGHYAGICGGNAGCDPLLFLFCGDGERICKDGVLYRYRRRSHF